MSDAFGSMRLFHPSGIAVELPVPVDMATKVDFRAALMAVNDALAAGWLAVPAGLESGEDRGMVGFVVRSVHEGKGGILVPVVDLYSTAANESWQFLRVYLDDPQRVAAFEYASGLTLAKMQEHDKGHLERGKSVSAKYFNTPARPFGVIFTYNPKFDPNETDVAKKKPKRIFARWVDEMPAKAAEPPKENPAVVSEADAQRDRDAADTIALARIDDARTDPELMAVWYDLTPDCRDRVLTPFTNRKAAINPPDRIGLVTRITEAARKLRVKPDELISRFSVALKLDVKRLPGLPNLTDAQLMALCRLATNAAMVAAINH